MVGKNYGIFSGWDICPLDKKHLHSITCQSSREQQGWDICPLDKKHLHSITCQSSREQQHWDICPLDKKHLDSITCQSSSEQQGCRAVDAILISKIFFGVSVGREVNGREWDVSQQARFGALKHTTRLHVPPCYFGVRVFCVCVFACTMF